MKVTVWVIRVLFIAVTTWVAWYTGQAQEPYSGLSFSIIGLLLSMTIVALDVVLRRKSLTVVVAVVVGLLVGTLLELLVRYILGLTAMDRGMIPGLELAILVFFCYVCVTVILQTKDDFRMVVPYVRFSKESSGPRPMVLDTSVIIDGRIADIADANVFDNPLVVPRFVLEELQGIADSPDPLKRNRGRRGLDMLNRIQKNEKVTVEIRDLLTDSPESVDTRLVKLASMLHGRVVTNDFNLNKIAQLQGVDVVNVNDLAKALRPVVLPGEELAVRVIKPGQEPGQGVGYLDDGTMVVVENGRDHMDRSVRIMVTSVLQTSAGRMIFGKPH